MFNKTDAMIKASMIAKAREEVADLEKSLDAAAQAGVAYAVEFFTDMIEQRTRRIEWLRAHIVHPGC